MINLHDPYTTSVQQFKDSTVQRQTQRMFRSFQPLQPFQPSGYLDRIGGFHSDWAETSEIGWTLEVASSVIERLNP
jgi:hypothetical protein